MAMFKKMFGMDEFEQGSDSQPEVAEESVAESAEEGQLAVDVYQTKDNIVIKSTIAGVKPDDLDITITENQVVIQGKRHQDEEVSGDDYFMQECYWGGFYRAVDMPVEINSDEAEADIKDGILTIILPKVAKSKTKKLKVRQEA